MNKFSTFLFGIALGATLMYVGLKYHVVRATDGFHMVAKSKAELGTAYVDVRNYTANDWSERLQLATDIANSDNDALKEEVAEATVNNSLDSMWQEFSSPIQ